MRKLAVLLLIAAMPLLGQNIGLDGRWPSDTGPSVFAYATKTDTSTSQITAAPSAGVSFYLYEAYCVNTSANTQTAMLIKYSTTTVAAVECPPAALGVKPRLFRPPLKFPAATAVTFNMVAGATTARLYASGKLAR